MPTSSSSPLRLIAAKRARRIPDPAAAVRLSLLHVLGGEQEIASFRHLLRLDADDGDGMLVVGQSGDQSGQQASAIPELHRLRNFGNVQHEAVSLVRKEVERLVRRRLNGFHHVVLCAGLREVFIHHARAHAAQLTVAQAQNRRVFRGGLVFHDRQRRAVVLDQLGAAFVAVSIPNLGHFLTNHVVQLLFALQNALKPRDGFENRGVFPAKRLDFQPGKALKAHIQNRLRLNIRQTEPRNQLLLGFLGAFAFADQRDNLVQMV